LTALEPPAWWEIAFQVRPWWRHLSVLETDGSVLRTVSYMAERYLDAGGEAFVGGDGDGDGGSVTNPRPDGTSERF
jgi:hypothetical protein